MASTLGKDNPFRYRGYYYDIESGFYYLNSRYYDPETGRFINADGIDILLQDQDSIIQYNMFAYCLNDPISMADPSGKSAAVALAGGATAAAAAGPIGWALLGAVGVTVLFAATYIAIDQTLSRPMTLTIPKPKAKDKAKEETKDAVIPKPKEPKRQTYYHVTSNDTAMLIWASGTIMGSKWEGGHVFAWRLKPDKKAIDLSGAHDKSVVISFETAAAFETDTGITNPYVKSFGPVRNVIGKSVSVYNVTVVARYF